MNIAKVRCCSWIKKENIYTLYKSKLQRLGTVHEERKRINIHYTNQNCNRFSISGYLFQIIQTDKKRYIDIQDWVDLKVL